MKDERGLRSALVAALLLPLLGLAPHAPAAPGPAHATAERAAPVETPEACGEDCTLRVENRLGDIPVEVYLHVTERGELLGTVGARETEVFALPEREWQHVQLSVREAGTHAFVNLACVRSFEDGEARAVLREGDPLERC